VIRVCLLVVVSRVVPGTPLLIGANRDELMNRPATVMTVLDPGPPRILGGRDELSGGTWLAVNAQGVFAGLTNQPLGEAKDPSRRSRGELPLALARHTSAPSAVDAFLETHQPADYNGSWLLVGDRSALFYIDFTGLVEPEAIALPPGLHVLENRPLGAPSPKVDHMTGLLGALSGDADAALSALQHALVDHVVPPAGPEVPPTLANCVHLDGYGTRSSCLVRMDEAEDTPPRIWVADGAPCAAPFDEVSRLWTAPQ
jgi:uncharacterized protein with NRDE domain